MGLFPSTQVELTAMVCRSAGSPGNFIARLIFDAQGSTCAVTTVPGSAYPVIGMGKFSREDDEWGGKKRNTIILSYQITDSKNGEFHQVNDILVIRDRALVLETFTPVIK